MTGNLKETMQAFPFSFPAPITIYNEHCIESEGRYSDKSLGLWKIDSLALN